MKTPPPKTAQAIVGAWVEDNFAQIAGEPISEVMRRAREANGPDAARFDTITLRRVYHESASEVLGRVAISAARKRVRRRLKHERRQKREVVL